MTLSFPDHFIFGTSTAAAQIETAFEHDWQGVKSRDGYIFERTTDHELRFPEDATIISSLAPGYRMSLQWSKLQREPLGEFDLDTVEVYHKFLTDLKSKGVTIMMVLHHFTNPLWFARLGSWEKEENIPLWVNYCKKVIDEFGHYVSSWNTFNEPNVYASYGWITGFFPPFKINPYLAGKAVKNMGKAHNVVYDYIKQKFPEHPVGISHNTVIFNAENVLGWFPSRLSDWWFMEYVPSHFTKVDFFGMSYYARVTHDPLPVTYMDTPDKIKKLNKAHDDMWEYHPEGLRECIDRYWNKYKKPIIITENGVCDASDELRQKAITDYAGIIHQAIQDGIDIRGYYWWSAWDNFEWHLGPTFRFGLYECDLETKERRKRKSAEVYQKLAHSRKLTMKEAAMVEL
ncbi:MAG: glycoside hydrolase family 1 protein [Cyclobacteriaceae bacterium]|nr:glycoside hydrolase family 1 protein [Cyclobacteriaceae bacterium]